MNDNYENSNDNPSGITERFQIEKILSSGKTSLAYKAKDTILEETVTVKTMAPETVKSENIQTYHNELRILKEVEHDSIAKVFDYGQTKSGKPYMVLEYLNGVSLKEFLKAKQSMDPKMALSILRHLCEALAIAHQMDVVHRDIKPSNIFLVRTPEEERFPVLVDFGFGLLRKENDKGIVKSMDGTFAGESYYMSPEQIQGKEYDYKTDIYSLGCVFHEMITGDPPHRGSSDEETFTMHLSSPLNPLPKLNANDDLSFKIQRVTEMLLTKNPEERLGSLEDLLNELETVDPRPQKKQEQEPKPEPKKNQKIKIKEKSPETKKLPSRKTSEHSFSFLQFLGSTIVLSLLLIVATTVYSQVESKNRQLADRPIGTETKSKDTLLEPYLKGDDIHLKIKFINITDEDAQYLSNHSHLETMHIGGSMITPNGLQILANMPNIKEVKIYKPAHVSQADLDQLNGALGQAVFVIDSKH